MPNIVITNKCNQNCPYCFANEIMNTSAKEITLDEFLKILKWLIKSNEHNIGLIGGEPSLHPLFKDFLEIFHSIKKDGYFLVNQIFSNGTNLLPYIDLLQEMEVTININNPLIVGQEKYQLTCNTIQELNKNTDIITFYAFNLYLGVDYNFILDFLKKYPPKESVRISYVDPRHINKENKYFQNKDKYFEDGKDLCLSFTKELQKLKIQAHWDCAHIPHCFYNNEELKLLKTVFDNGSGEDTLCTYPAIDFISSQEIIPCFGTSIPVNLNNFNNMIELMNYLKLKVIPELIEGNNYGKCKDCDELKYRLCQGGCLSFSQNYKNFFIDF